MKKILAIILIALADATVAQQLPHYTQYLINDFPMNPAIAGTKMRFVGKSNHRYQWAGITDAPRTYIFSLNGPLKNPKIGVGSTLFTDITGPTRRTGLQVAYAYHVKLSETMHLSFGLTGGLLQFTVDGSKITTKEPGDIAFSSGLMTALVPDGGAGVYWYGEHFFLSLSAPQIIQYKLGFFDDYPETMGRLVNHYFIFGGYRFDLSDDITIEPSAMVKYVQPAPVQAEPTLRFIYRDLFWAGASYRTAISPFEADAIGLMLGYVYQENLMFGYSYDIAMSNLKNYSSGTHELMIGIRFKNNASKGGSKSSIE